jgi:hypothetical protein
MFGLGLIFFVEPFRLLLVMTNDNHIVVIVIDISTFHKFILSNTVYVLLLFSTHPVNIIAVHDD